jgi:outer membrane protein OmpA-like peptidoglycan-associated protein
MIKLKALIRKKWFLVLSSIILVVVITLTALPMVIQRVAVAWLQANGADRATIGDIDLNLFTGRLGVFDVAVEKAGETPLRVWRLTADVDLWRLIRKRFFIKSVWLYDADLVVKQQEDGSLAVGGIPLVSKPQAETQQQVDAGAPSFLDRWGVGIDIFAIRNSTIRYQSSLLDELVDIKKLYALNVFSWEPEQHAQVNFEIYVNQHPFILESDTRVFKDTPDTSSTLQVADLDLSHYAPLAKQAGIDEIKGFLSLSMKFDAIYQADNTAHITVDSQINLSDFRLRQGDLLLEHENLSYQNSAKVKYPASPGEQLATTQGQLTIQDQTVAMADMHASYSELKWNGAATMQSNASADAPPVVNVQGNLGVAGLQVKDTAAKLTLADIKNIAAKEISINAPDDVRVGELTVRGVNALLQNDSSNNLTLPEVALELGVLKQVQFNNKTQSASVANVELNALSAQTADKKLQLANVNTVSLEQAALSLQKSVSINHLTLQQVRALKPLVDEDTDTTDPVVQLSQTRLESIEFQFEPQSLQLQSVDLDGLNILMKRHSDSSLYAIEHLPAVEPTEKSSLQQNPELAEEQSTTPLLVKVQQVKIGNNSTIRIVDQSVKPTFKTTVSPLNLTIENIDSTDPASRTSIDMNASVNSGNRITANGWLTPFADKRDAEIKLNIHALDLVMFSPYSAQAAGYQVRSGRINVTLNGNIDDDIVKLNTELVAQRLNLDATSDAAREQSAQTLGIGMPIDAALALMKDKKGNITIEVPVSGNLEDPNFAIGPAFRKAMLQAVKKGSVTYAAYVLQPYGSILIGAKLLGKATALRLESVRFDAGEAKLNQRAKNYLKKIAGLMNDRPGINITLCGTATGSDRKELSNRNVNQMEQALRSLAEQRGDEVKKHLIDQFGIAADRFFDCQPRVTSDESAQPEVRLGL